MENWAYSQASDGKITAERVDVPQQLRATAEQAHRDDLARDVAQLWAASQQEVVVRDGWLPLNLTAALDRLAAAYCTDA